MSMTDPIADLLTRIRNANHIGARYVDIPSSGVKVDIVQVLKREGYIEGFEIVEKPVQNDIRVTLKYSPEGERVIQKIKRESRPGLRNYVKIDELRPVRRGLGIYVLSTSKGVLSDREARKENVGGELLAQVY